MKRGVKEIEEHGLNTRQQHRRPNTESPLGGDESTIWLALIGFSRESTEILMATQFVLYFQFEIWEEGGRWVP